VKFESLMFRHVNVSILPDCAYVGGKGFSCLSFLLYVEISCDL
jgi:hypothetical protein